MIFNKMRIKDKILETKSSKNSSLFNPMSLHKDKVHRHRFSELDMLRGLALLMMIYFHVIYDLRELYSYDIHYGSGINFYLGKSAAILFIFISGISSTLSRSNTKRGLKILIIAVALTIITGLLGSTFIIWFGILHFLAIAMLLSHFLTKCNQVILFLFSLSSIAIGLLFQSIPVTQPFLFPIGLVTINFYSSDYYPIFPWLGIYILGIIGGKIVYTPPQKHRQNIISHIPNSIKQISNSLFYLNQVVLFIGKRTLIIYLLHQPIILLLTYVLLGSPK